MAGIKVGTHAVSGRYKPVKTLRS